MDDIDDYNVTSDTEQIDDGELDHYCETQDTLDKDGDVVMEDSLDEIDDVHVIPSDSTDGERHERRADGDFDPEKPIIFGDPPNFWPDSPRRPSACKGRTS